jgi:hypothetical protein
VSRDAQVMQILATWVITAKSHHRWSRVCRSGGGCREMHLGNASESWRRGQRRQRAIIVGAARVEAAVGVGRCNLGMQILATRVTKATSHHRWSRACRSRGGCREGCLSPTIWPPPLCGLPGASSAGAALQVRRWPRACFWAKFHKPQAQI